MIDLSKNKNPFYPSKQIYNILKLSVKNLSKYPSPHLEKCEKSISKMLKIKCENCCIVSGTMEGIHLIVKCLSKKMIGTFTPTFWGISYIAEKNGYNLYEKKINNELMYNELDLIELASKSDIVYLCNPNNPTLSYLEKNKLLKIIKEYPNCHFIIDETVLEFDKNFSKKTLYKQVSKFQNLSILFSLSKILSLPGLRIGLLITNRNMKEKIKKEKIVYSVNVVAETLLDNLKNIKFNFDKNRKKIKENFIFFKNKLQKDKIRSIIIRDGSFILIDFNDTIDTIQLQKYLENEGIIVSCMKTTYPNFNGNWIRVSAGKKKELKKLAKKINNYLKTIIC